MAKLKFCVCGAGAGGLAISAYLASRGCAVNLYNRSAERIAPLRHSKEITAQGELEGRFDLDLVTSDLGEAIDGVQVIMVVIPAMAHGDLARHLAQHVQPGQLVILNPGRTFGALEVGQVFKSAGVAADVTIAEAQSLIFACRVLEPGTVKILKFKNSVPLSCMPAWRIPELITLLHDALPQFMPGDDILKTGLSNVGCILHPIATVLNSAWIEDNRGDFDFYHQGISRSVSLVIEAVDEERLAVARGLGITVPSVKEWIYLSYGIHGDTLYDALQNNPAYKGIIAPRNLNHRYVHEDIPMGLVPISSLGKMLGVATPTTDLIIQLAQLVSGKNFYENGRNVESLRLDGMAVKDLRELAINGLYGAT